MHGQRGDLRELVACKTVSLGAQSMIDLHWWRLYRPLWSVLLFDFWAFSGCQGYGSFTRILQNVQVMLVLPSGPANRMARLCRRYWLCNKASCHQFKIQINRVEMVRPTINRILTRHNLIGITTWISRLVSELLCRIILSLSQIGLESEQVLDWSEK